MRNLQALAPSIDREGGRERKRERERERERGREREREKNREGGREGDVSGLRLSQQPGRLNSSSELALGFLSLPEVSFWRPLRFPRDTRSSGNPQA